MTLSSPLTYLGCIST